MYSVGALLFHMHFPDHPTGPLPLGEGTSGVDLSVLSLPRDTDAATVSLLKALLAAEPDKRPNAADALQVFVCCVFFFLNGLFPTPHGWKGKTNEEIKGYWYLFCLVPRKNALAKSSC